MQFTEATFNRIAENIKMVFSSGSDDHETFRDLSLNSLGSNNFLYIATIMSELEIAGKSDIFTVLLIEEPEAHLHPQLQVRFMKYLEQLEDSLGNVQIIVTTHSATLASSVGIGKLIHLSRHRNDDSITSTTMSEKNFGDSITEAYINRWLDATKSTMLFSRGVILVEGIAESIIIPRLAELVLAKYNKEHKATTLLPLRALWIKWVYLLSISMASTLCTLTNYLQTSTALLDRAFQCAAQILPIAILDRMSTQHVAKM